MPEARARVLWSHCEARAWHDVAKSHAKPVHVSRQEPIWQALLDGFNARLKLWRCFRSQVAFLLTPCFLDQTAARVALPMDEPCCSQAEHNYLLFRQYPHT